MPGITTNARAGMIQKLGDWKWSGYPFYGEGEKNQLLTPHPCFTMLGQNDLLRQREYQNFVDAGKEESRNPVFSDPHFEVVN